VQRSLSEKIIRNTLFNSVGFAWDFLIRFLLVPYVVAHLGQTRSAIWAFLGVFTAPFMLLDFGVESSFVKYIAEHYARKEHDGINRVVSTGLAFYLVFGIVVSLIVFVGADAFVRLSSLEPGLASEGAAALRLTAVSFLLINLVKVFESVFSGVQRMEITNLVRIAISVPYVALTVLFLERQMGICGLMWRDILVTGIQLVAVALCAFKVLPNLKLRLVSFVDRETFGKLFRFGIKVHVSRISLIVNLHFDKFLIAGFLDRSFGAGLVLFYDLATRVLSMARMFPALLFSATLPATSELAAQGEAERVYELLRRSTKYVMFLGAPMMAVVIVAAPALVAAWMGTGYDLSAQSIQILAMGYLALCLGGAVGSVVQGIGRPGIQVKAALFALVVHVVLGVAVVCALRSNASRAFYGILCSTSVALVASLLYYYAVTLKAFGRSVAQFCADTLWKPLVVCAVLGAGMSAVVPVFGLVTRQTRLGNIGLVLAYTVVFSTLYLALIVWWRYLDERDWQIAREGARRVFGRFYPGA